MKPQIVSNIDFVTSENEQTEDCRTKYLLYRRRLLRTSKFVCNENTKKECTKQYLAKIIKLRKSKIEVSCLRPYKGKKYAFIFL